MIIFVQVLTETSYTRSVDWWGLGVLIFEMLVGEVRTCFLTAKKKKKHREKALKIQWNKSQTFKSQTAGREKKGERFFPPSRAPHTLTARRTTHPLGRVPNLIYRQTGRAQNAER